MNKIAAKQQESASDRLFPKPKVAGFEARRPLRRWLGPAPPPSPERVEFPQEHAGICIVGREVGRPREKRDPPPVGRDGNRIPESPLPAAPRGPPARLTSTVLFVRGSRTSTRSTAWNGRLPDVVPSKATYRPSAEIDGPSAPLATSVVVFPAEVAHEHFPITLARPRW